MPVVITEAVPNDSDDPAIWVNYADPAQSLILGTDKDDNGGIYVYDLNGKIDHSRSVTNLKRPNNIDVEYGLRVGNRHIDIAVFTERERNVIRVFSLPDMQALDNGGIPVFVGEKHRRPMGIGLYKDPATAAIYAIVSRQQGVSGSYLWQYLLTADDNAVVRAEVVRKFGLVNGDNEIEAVVIDDALGYVYYSEELVGVHKYHASPTAGNERLALFATDNFIRDREGLSIFPTSPTTGYILVSDQQGNRFHIFPREGSAGNSHAHPLLKIVPVLAKDSDGSEVTAFPLNDTFRHGLFVAMSNDKTFHYYRWEDIAGDVLNKHGYWQQQ